MSYVDSNLSTSSTPAMSLASPSTTSPSAARRLRTKTSDFTDLLRRSHSHRESHPPPLPAGTAELAKEPGARSKRRIPLFGLKRKSAGAIKDASASASESESTTKTKDWRKLNRLSAGASFQPTASSSSSPRPPLPPGRHSSSTTLSPNSSLPPLNVPTPSFSPISQFTRSPTSSPSVPPPNGAGRSTTPTPSSVTQKSLTTSHHRDRHRGSASGQDRENATPTGSPTKPDFSLHSHQQYRDSNRDTPTPTATSTSASASNSASNSVSTSASSLPSPVSVMSSSAFFIPLPPSSAAKLREREREQERERSRPTITISPAPMQTAAELAEEENMYVSPREAPVPTAVSAPMHQRSSSIVRASGEANVISGQRSSVERVRPAPPSNSALPRSSSRIASPSSSQVRSDGELSTGSGTSTSMFSGRGRRPTYHSHRLHVRTPSVSTSATSATGSSRDELERVLDFRSSASESERELDRGRRKLALSTPGKGRLPMPTGAQPRSPSTTPSPSPTPTATPQRHVRKPMPTPAQLIRERAVEAFEAESAKNIGSGSAHARSESNNSAELEAVLELGAPFEKSEDKEKDSGRVLTPTRGRSGSTSTNASTSSVRSSSSRLRTTSARPSQLSNVHSSSTLEPSGTRSATASPVPAPSLRSRTTSAASSMNASLKARLRESFSPPASPSQSPIPSGTRMRVSPTTPSPSRKASLAAASPPPQKPLPIVPTDSMRSVRSISTSSASGSSLSAQTLVSMPSSISTAPSSSSASSGTLVAPSGSKPESISGLPTIPSFASLPVPQDKSRARTHSPPLKSIDERTSKDKDATTNKSTPDPLQAALARNAELEAEKVALLARIDVLERAARRRDREISGLRYLVVNGHVGSGEESSPEQASTPGEKKDSPPTRTHRAYTVPGPNVNSSPRTRNAEDVGSTGLGIVVDESVTLDAIPETENQEVRLRPPNGAPAPEANRDSASSSSVLTASSSSQSGLGTEKEGTEERRREKEERRASKALRRISAAGALPRASSETASAQYAQNLARDRTPSIAQVIERERASSEREVGMEEMLKRLRVFAGKAERR